MNKQCQFPTCLDQYVAEIHAGPEEKESDGACSTDGFISHDLRPLALMLLHRSADFVIKDIKYRNNIHTNIR